MYLSEQDNFFFCFLVMVEEVKEEEEDREEEDEEEEAEEEEERELLPLMGSVVKQHVLLLPTDCSFARSFKHFRNLTANTKRREMHGVKMPHDATWANRYKQTKGAITGTMK